MEATELRKYFNGEKKHPYYFESVRLAKEIAVHAKGEFPELLITERRPSESEFIKNYRRKIWQPITTEPVSQVESELMKIRKADDWSIKYKPNTSPPSIKEGETLEDYCERKFPEYTSVTNWAFSVLLDCYLIDANGLMLVLPIDRTDNNADFLKPFPFFYNSKQILEITKDIAILEISKREEDEPKRFYVVDKTNIITYREAEAGYALEEKYVHHLGYLPIIHMKGFYKESKYHYILWQSRISGMIPRLNEAVREYSDLQAEVVQHIHSEKWVYSTQICNACKGVGKVRQGNAVAIEATICNQCNGSGKIATSPYSNLVITPAKTSMGEQPIPTPPMGYIEKQVEIVKIQDERIDKHIYKALCAVNMQYLDKVPLSESGIAKAVDKDSLNNFVHSVAEDIVRIMDEYYRICCDYRYSILIPDKEKRHEMLPVINVPSKLDILSATYLIDEVKRLKDGNVNPVIVNATEIELANKKFNADPEIRNLLQCVYALDPLSGISQDDKMIMLQNKGITHEDYVISCNIQRLVKQAMYRHSDFYYLPLDKKEAIIMQLVQPILTKAEPKPIAIPPMQKEEEEEPEPEEPATN